MFTHIAHACTHTCTQVFIPYTCLTTPSVRSWCPQVRSCYQELGVATGKPRMPCAMHCICCEINHPNYISNPNDPITEITNRTTLIILAALLYSNIPLDSCSTNSLKNTTTFVHAAYRPCFSPCCYG
jgi:hypothetical protein